ncbi:hypothetical protein VTN77DRAFT_1986 [Rasamsonia byssochlamydoides]|uniref:uncharacterized protein n=1 Tax=Rasamsonia byssochlamydoides TaxID=89139 RepID=UPI0037420AE6
MMKISSLTWISTVSFFLTVSGELSAPPRCVDFNFTIHNPALNDFGFPVPAATYNISATYCPPTAAVVHRARSIQLLVHGATGNKLYWSALAQEGFGFQPSNYSWVDFARHQGYHTLAIDRLGCGNSSHPNPTVVRVMPDVNTVSQIVGILHSKERPLSLSFLPSFSTIILNGFSFGSVTVDYLLKYPPSPSVIPLISATILSGYSHIINPHPNPAVSISSQQFGPAAQVFPSRFGGLNPGYVTITNAPNYADSFFAGAFDPAIPPLIWSREDVQAVGEQDSISGVFQTFNVSAVPAYTAPLAIVAGQFDQPLCGGDCGGENTSTPDLIALSRQFYPGVPSEKYFGYRVPQTGHMLHYHESARRTMGIVHSWLTKIGL